MQLALTGVRDLSIIASPPVDRLAVRTFVSPFDPITVREALLREKYRGGQAFYVCPRIEDLAGAKDFLDKNVPEVRVGVAHGQMPPTVLDDIMTAFYDGKYDVLLSTTIIESGLDIPTANTLIVHRADMFGLAQLYQLRGRVGRAKLRAYALLTLPAQQKITAQAERRLKVLQSLDTLGAGFQLASHDLDIRGAGNLLGDEQSGHIKEVGFELYQQMLEEAVLSLKAGISAPVADRWSPSITIGTALLIPEDYVADLSVRLALYRRLAEIEDERDIDSFAAEMVDRFGAAAGRGRASVAGGGDQGAVPARQCREARGRAEGRGAVVPRQYFRQSGRADRLHPRSRVRACACAPIRRTPRPSSSCSSTTGSGRRIGSKAPRRFCAISLSSRNRPRRRNYSAASWPACAMRSIASARYSGDCAPETANLPPKMKQGTPSMPASLADCASRSISATSWSLASAARTSSGSRPTSVAACTSTARSVEIGAFGEIEVHQPLLHLGRFADPFRPADQPVAVERVGLPLHLVGRVDEAFFRRRGADALRDALVALGRAELGGEILLARHAFARNPVIEEVGPPMHLDRDIRPQRQRLFQAVLADEAPRADHVGDDVDANGLGCRAWLTPVGANLITELLGGNHPAAHHARHQAVERVAGLQRRQRQVGGERVAPAQLAPAWCS